MIRSMSLEMQTEGHGQVIAITREVERCVRQSQMGDGIVTVFTPSATSGVTTLEYESGAVHDLQRLFDEIASPDRDYQHNLRWQDGNGHSHVRAALLGPSLTIPFVEGRLTLGTWQHIVFIDFDNRPRQRSLVVQIMGE